MVSELIDKYIWLVQTFIDAGPGGLSLPEIADRWTARYGGTDYPRRSFNNHREAVAEVFGIEIACNRSTNRYYIDAGESAVDKRQSVDWLVNTFTVNNLLSLGKERLSGRVAVEDIPSGQKHLVTVMQAMLDNAVMELRYRKYLSEEEEIRHIRPYAVKEFEKRWYIVAYSEEAETLRVYAMDRILSLTPTGEHFKMPKGFRVDDLFEASYGQLRHLPPRRRAAGARAAPDDGARSRLPEGLAHPPEPGLPGGGKGRPMPLRHARHPQSEPGHGAVPARKPARSAGTGGPAGASGR